MYWSYIFNFFFLCVCDCMQSFSLRYLFPVDRYNRYIKVKKPYENRILQKTYGPECEDGMRSTSNNNELQLSKSPDIIIPIKVLRFTINMARWKNKHEWDTKEGYEE